MGWLERQLERSRSTDPMVVDALLAVAFTVAGLVTVFAQEIRDRDGLREPGALAIVTVLMACVPVAFRRRAPLPALLVADLGILVHILVSWPEGSLPLAVLFLTYSVGAWCPLREALVGLVAVGVTIAVIGVTDSPGLDLFDVLGILGQFAAAWALGVAIRNRRAAIAARVREAEERAEAGRHETARALAEERLRIAQELHDVVAHSMSVIAVQAGVGAHVLDERPEQARAALEAISATSRGTLTELRRLLGVLRENDGSRAPAPAPGLADLPRLVDDVRSAGVPVALDVEGAAEGVHAGVELSAYRVVQEALTNVIKHAGAPTRVDVTVRYLPGALTLDVIDDGRGLAADARDARSDAASGHGLIGMRERVEVWGGELAVGPAPGGGYRVSARLPYGEAG